MTDFTPTTDQVREAYVRAMRNAFIASASEHAAEFDRWLAREKTVAHLDGYSARVADEQHGIGAGADWLRGMQADAWDEGHHATGEWAMGEMLIGDAPDNPYRRQENDGE